MTLDSHCLLYTLDNLREKAEYMFAVFAENAAGISPAAITENVVLNANASKFIMWKRKYYKLLIHDNLYQPYHLHQLDLSKSESRPITRQSSSGEFQNPMEVHHWKATISLFAT